MTTRQPPDDEEPRAIDTIPQPPPVIGPPRPPATTPEPPVFGPPRPPAEPAQEERRGFFHRLTGREFRASGDNQPSDAARFGLAPVGGTTNLEPAFANLREGVDRYGESTVRAAYLEQQSLQTLTRARASLADFRANNDPATTPNRLTREDVRQGRDRGQSQQQRFNTRQAALQQQVTAAEGDYETRRTESESAGVSDDARTFVRREFSDIPGALNFVPGTNRPRAIAAAINPTGAEGTQVTRGEEISIRRATATDAIEGGAAAVTVATGPGLLYRAGQGTIRVVSGSAARQTLRQTAAVTAREGGQEIAEEGLLTGLTSATSGQLPNATGSISEITGETILEVIGRRRGRITVNSSSGNVSVGGQQLQPGQGAYDPSTQTAVVVNAQGQPTVLQGVVIEGSVVSVDGVAVNRRRGPAPAAGFDPGDSSGRTALAVRPGVQPAPVDVLSSVPGDPGAPGAVPAAAVAAGAGTSTAPVADAAPDAVVADAAVADAAPDAAVADGAATSTPPVAAAVPAAATPPAATPPAATPPAAAAVPAATQPAGRGRRPAAAAAAAGTAGVVGGLLGGGAPAGLSAATGPPRTPQGGRATGGRYARVIRWRNTTVKTFDRRTGRETSRTVRGSRPLQTVRVIQRSDRPVPRRNYRVGQLDVGSNRQGRLALQHRPVRRRTHRSGQGMRSEMMRGGRSRGGRRARGRGGRRRTR